MADNVPNSKELYLKKYCKTYSISEEVGKEHALVKEVFSHYDKQTHVVEDSEHES